MRLYSYNVHSSYHTVIIKNTSPGNYCYLQGKPTPRKSNVQQSFAMRKETDDVTTERLVELTARLVAVLPRGRGFRLGADGSISVYPASPRVRLPAAE